jgi:hypothetical protein
MRRLRRRAWRKLAEFGFPFLAFTGGAALGAWLQLTGGFLVLSVPLAALGAVWLLMLAILLRERRAAAAAAAVAAAAAATAAAGANASVGGQRR